MTSATQPSTSGAVTPILSGVEAQLPSATDAGLEGLAVAKPRSKLASLIPFFGEERRTRMSWELATFLVFVVLPSFVAVIYFAFIAAPVYVVETRLVVRSADIRGGTDANNVSVGSSAAVAYSAAAQPAHIVAHFIRSRSIVEEVLQRVDLRQIYTHDDTDPLSRLKENASIEELTKYWQNMTRAYVDGPSGIIFVEVKAFRAEDAYAISEAVIAVSEKLVNEISRKARRDILQAAEEELQHADEQLRGVLAGLQQARNNEGMLDPVKAAEATSKLLIELTAEKVRLENDIFVASRSLSQNAPSIRQSKARLQALDDQIEKLRGGLAGDATAKANVAASLRKFEELETRRLLAEKLLTISEEGLERARARADRQLIYFMVFVPPTMPTKALLPARLSYSIIFPLGFLIAWAIGTLLWKTIEDHRN